MSVLVETTLGDMVIDLFTDERPQACKNFLKLCKIKYYNYALFHFVQRNFIAQTGDPTGTGRGGESIYGHLYGDQAKYFEAETTPKIKHSKAGLVSMVNGGENVHGSQFLITLRDELDRLDGIHTVFGEIAEGMDVLEKLNEAICDEEHRPYQDIRITHTSILHDPYDDPPGLQIPDRSPEPTKEQLSSGRIGADEEIDKTKGKTAEEIEEDIQEKEATARATILEMVGDIPDVDVKPPENVLFVCKLNPVTTDEDLEIIFSRFGKIGSCEVIRDKDSGESLQYAFIEFEEEKDCENAFLKMDNVLIDDRRIHVDFSQSVSKLKWMGKGRGVIHKDSKRKDRNSYVLKDQQRSRGDYKLVLDDGSHGHKEKKRKHRHHSSSESEGERQKKIRKDKNGSHSKKHKGKHKESRNDLEHDRKERETEQNYMESSKERKKHDRSHDRKKHDRSRERYIRDKDDRRRRERDGSLETTARKRKNSGEKRSRDREKHHKESRKEKDDRKYRTERY